MRNFSCDQRQVSLSEIYLSQFYAAKSRLKY